MANLEKSEMETCILFNAGNRSTVHVFSDDKTWQRKLERAGAVITKVYSSGGKEYELQYRQISIRKLGKKKEMSEEQRQAASERLKKMREAKNKNDD